METNRYYQYYQPNKHKTTDCVVRALCAAEDKTWFEIYDELVAIGRKMMMIPSEMKVVEKYLSSAGYKSVSVKREKGVKATTLNAFCESHPKGVYVVRLAGHLVCVRDGKFYDIWDCGEYTIYKYFEK